MSSGQWEVVGRNKKDKINNQTTKKPGKLDKKRVPPAPKVEDIRKLANINFCFCLTMNSVCSTAVTS